MCLCTQLLTCKQLAVLAQGESELSKSQKKKQKKKAAAERKKACEDADVGMSTSTGSQSRRCIDEAAQSFERRFDEVGSVAGEKGAAPTGAPESNGCANGHATGNGHAAGGPAANGTAGKKQGKGEAGALPQHHPSCYATGGCSVTIISARGRREGGTAADQPPDGADIKALPQRCVSRGREAVVHGGVRAHGKLEEQPGPFSHAAACAEGSRACRAASAGGKRGRSSASLSV